MNALLLERQHSPASLVESIYWKTKSGRRLEEVRKNIIAEAQRVRPSGLISHYDAMFNHCKGTQISGRGLIADSEKIESRPSQECKFVQLPNLIIASYRGRKILACSPHYLFVVYS